MNNETQLFIEELKQRPEVQGIILFGSWARGNNRPDSDVDLVVILSEGYRRTVEVKGNQVFEIIYTTKQSALDYWKSHLDDASGLWSVAKVLYDKDNTVRQLKEEIEEVLQQGKKQIDDFQLGQFKFDAEDQIRYVGKIIQEDETTANLILSNKVFALTELFFDIRQQWTPAPKQRLAKIKEVSPEYYALLQQFYTGKLGLEQKIEVAMRMLPIIFEVPNN